VGDDGFDFQGPQRREAKRFEPPPWEREAFEELQRKRAEEELAAELLRSHQATQGAGPQAEQASEEASTPTVEPAVMEVTASGDTAKAAEEAPGAEDADVQLEQPAGGGKAPGRKPQAEDPRVVEMLAGLAVEEPPVHKGFWKVAIASAIVLGAIGGVLIIWAMAAFVGAQKTGATGVIGGGVLLVFGAGFVFGALWLAVRTLRQRGVL